ncbi:hypothetical protein [Acaryochloris sp. IP29b_bin.137]|uniref:DUF7925 domain-containing protein n=1 Tax=Acaryochloris sp. IP29b_bin.137 TaxID=2969217 RepID=UPI00262C40FB|nr:hypothetical protein [Acaryochloris sp. IP29b_bin.137]
MTDNRTKSDLLPSKVGPLTIAAILASSLLQPFLPAHSLGTPAGEQISNTATATYREDPSSPTTINATSNTITVTVAEVAGVIAIPSGFTDSTGGAVSSGDTLEFTFDITNIGNAPTNLFIPGINNLGTENFVPSAVQIVNASGTVLETVPPGGSTLSALSISGLADLDSDQILKVRVTGTPAAGTPGGADVGVTLGDTGPNNNNPVSTQNQPDNADGPRANEIRTIDANPGNGVPENGEREASATNSIPFGNSIKTMALATVTKTVSNLNPGLTAAANDDLVTYDLGMTVENTSPNAAFLPGTLEGTPIRVNGSVVPRILVSDAIPVGTQLSSVDSIPANWQAIYATTPTGTAATAAAWFTTPPPLTSVTRIGFIYTAGPTISRNNSYSPFRFTVVTAGLPANGGQINNIAQVFGETFGDSANEVVYDESGDSHPNNFNDNQTPPDSTGSNYDPNTDIGVANPVTQGTDTEDNNSGSGPKGEVNVIRLGEVASSDDIFNGPVGVPRAGGPLGDNDDFTNRSTDIPAGFGPTDTFDPAPSTFANSVQNPASTGSISDVTLQPISPTQAEGADESTQTGQYGANEDIPNGTIVTIAYDPDGTPDNGDELTATYRWNSTTNTFGLIGSTTGGAADGIPKHVNIGSLPAGRTVDYQVTIDLPEGVRVNDDIPIPLLAFPDDDPVNNPGFTGETTNNITIDRLYTGFLRVTKEVQVLDANEEVIQAWTADQTILDGINNQLDHLIEYRITYENISTPAVGNGNVTLTVPDLTLVEDGTATVGEIANNWARFSNHQQKTSADQGVVRYFTNNDDPNPLTTSDPVDDTKVEKYENEVGQVDPGQVGQFLFRRRIK